MSVQAGDVIGGKYLLRRLIGRGGMGHVFVADEPAQGRSVAIKILHPKFASNENLTRRFLAEAVATSRVRHPNSVAMYDCNFMADGTPFFVMEYVRGRPLGRIIAEQQIPLPRALDILEQICSALAAIHASGLVHADVTSENLLVEQLEDHEHVTLIDFGLARFIGSSMVVTDEHGEPVISGTPEYMAPEIIRGEPPTPSSDLYAVGVNLYEMLTGAMPFVGRSPSDVLARQLEELVVPPSRRRPDRDIRASFDRIVLKALDKNPEARFTDASEFARAVREAAREGSPPARVARGTRANEAGLEIRRAIGDAMAHGDVGGIADGYARLAQELLCVHRFRDAIRELEEGIDVVTCGNGPNGPDAPAAVDQLVVALAAAHEGNGDDRRARRIVASTDHHSTLNAPPLRTMRRHQLRSA